VWDGDQVLYEIRAQGKDSTPGFTLEDDNASNGTLDNNLYGRVGYTHGAGLDVPLTVYRLNLNGYSGTVMLVPHANWHGDFIDGTLLDGTRCTQSGNCPTLDWPGGWWMVDGNRNSPPPTPVWFGSLVGGKRDASGLQYLRNRYYDPRSGRFTQEDPIGLAGGLNLYGFAGGDPVNLSDPFGLCPPCVGLVDPSVVLSNVARAGRASELRRQLITYEDKVMADPRFQPGALTHCNEATCALADLMGAPTGPLKDSHGKALLANQIGANLAEAGSGYRPVSAGEAQELANEGEFVLGSAILSGHGHIAPVRPDNIPGEIVPGAGPVFANVGRTNALLRLSGVFRARDTSKVKFYTPSQ